MYAFIFLLFIYYEHFLIDGPFERAIFSNFSNFTFTSLDEIIIDANRKNAFSILLKTFEIKDCGSYLLLNSLSLNRLVWDIGVLIRAYIIDDRLRLLKVI